MTESNNFNPDIETAAIQSAQYFIADDGSLRFISPYLSSSNFDGSIPVFDGQISASSIQRGMYLSLDGTIGSNYYPVVKVSYDDPDLEAAPPSTFAITYLDSTNQEQTISYNALDLINVRYENWSEKYLGNQGWTLTSGGNAIFTNVGVRGEIEATAGNILGNLTLGGSLTASTDNGQLIISSSGIFGSTASGSININNINNKFSFTGNINANSGSIKKLTVGSGKSYPIINLIGTASVSDARYSGNFIMSLETDSKNFFPGEYFYIYGPKTSGSAFADGFSGTASVYFNSLTKNDDDSWQSMYVFQIITASYNSPKDLYFCRLAQQGFYTNYDFSQVTASSGSINFGYFYFGEYSDYSLSNPTIIDGLMLNSVVPSSFLGTGYTPDHIDLSGRFRLGRNSISYDKTELYVKGNIFNNKPMYSISSSVYTIPSSRSTLQDSNTFNIDSINNFVFNVTPSGASTVIYIGNSNSNFLVGAEIEFINLGSGSLIFKNNASSITIQSYLNRKTVSGQYGTAKLRKISSASWLLLGDLS